MQQGKRKAIYILTFLTCLIVGFAVAKLIKPDNREPSPGQEPELPIPLVEEPVRQYFSYADTFVRRETHKGWKKGLKNDTIMNVTYETRYTGCILNGDTTEKKSETKEVSRSIVKIDKEDPKPPVEEPKQVLPRMTNAQFQSLLNSTSDNILEGIGNEDVSGSVRITVRNQKEEGKKVRNVRDAREKIETRLWKSARVISLGHNEQTGQIISAVIEPVYP